jgi:acyl-CoA dehydrogenase
MGQRGSHTSDVILQDVRVPASALIGGVEGQGFKTAMKVLDRARLNIAAVCVGVAQRMLDETLAYAMDRQQFGQPIAEFQLVQAMLADSKTEIYAARCMTLDAARKADDAMNIATEASCAKLFARGRSLRAGAWRRGLHAGVSDRAAVPRRAPVPHLRRHQPDPAAGDRAQHDSRGTTLSRCASINTTTTTGESSR